MAVKLNLLPPGVGVAGRVGKLLKIAKMLGVIAVAFFLIFTLGISALFILNTSTLNQLNSDVDSLKSKIVSLESTEQQAVLLKDRVGKIKLVLGFPSAIGNLDKVNSFVASLPPTATLSELDVDPQNVDFSVQFTSINDLSTFLRTLADTKLFPSGVLTSFGFNPATGYALSVRLANK